MPGFSKTNLKDVEDTAGARRPGIEGRFARKHLDSEEIGVSYFRYAPDFKSTGGHHHKVQEEAYVVVGGSGTMRLDDEIVELRPWDVVRVAPEVVRAFRPGPDGLEFIAIGGTKPEEGDGVAVEDFWTD